jgi:PTH1 family peptidyl-tRNA hydrolase
MAGLTLRLVVGLGNPGSEYAATRHNAGFWFVDELARRHGLRLKPERRYQGDAARATIEGQDLWFLKPMTYMNGSGLAIRSLCDYLHIPSSEVLVAHDELDLPAGTVRLKLGGGAGGHNGLKDTITHMGDGFWRLRFGIGHPGNRDEVIDYVLRRPSPEDEGLILDSVQLAADHFPRLLTEGAEKVMNRLHTKPPKTDIPA